MSKLFGTDGVRGIANTELTCRLAYQLGQAGAYVLAKRGKRPKILIGKDSRVSGDMLEAALIAGMCSVGADAYLAEVITTPAIAYLTHHHGFSAGCMISASHNPMEYNGIKFFDADGFKLPDSIQDEIEDIILNSKELPLATGGDVGRRFAFPSAGADYAGFIAGTTPSRFDGLTVVLDCANGASSHVAPEIFARMGAKVIATGNTPDGTNINDGCGSTHPEGLQAAVVAHHADMGLAFDGDADRLIAVDETGAVIDGDKVMAICAAALKEQGKLNKNTLVITVMSNLGLVKAMEKAGIQTVQTKVGDRYVLEEMQKCGYLIGGEQSGHIIFLAHSTTGDGILSGVQLLSVLVESGKKASELASIMEVWPQVLVNAKVPSGKQKTYTDYPEIMEKIGALEQKYANTGRVLIRPSGTEPVIRVMIEGQDTAKLQADAQALADFLTATIR